MNSWAWLLAAVIGSALMLLVVVTLFAYLTLFERVVIARFQVRRGPNRVGPMGLLQPAADGVKLIFKESFIPAQASRTVYLMAPAIAVFAALAAFAVLPLGLVNSSAPLPVGLERVGNVVTYQLANINVGILFIFAVGAMNVYALVLGGWASNSKYSLLGGLRSAAQLISYEMALGLSVLGVFILAHSVRVEDIVQAQGHLPFIVLQPLGFAIYLIAAAAETNRAPFDLPEAEQELVAGYHTEYSGFKFAMFYMAEYINMIMVALLASMLFLAGWNWPVLPPIVWLVVKMLFFLFLYVWVRATLPRLRYDGLMRLGWKVLLPLGLINTMLTAVASVAFTR